MKKILALLLSSVMLLSSIAFADGNNVKSVKINDSITVTELTKDNLLFAENGERIVVSLNGTETKIKNLNTGKYDYFKVDLENNTIYSSITGKTLPLPGSYQSMATRAGGISTTSDGKGDIFLRTGSVTFAYIEQLVSSSSGFATAAAAVVTLYPGIGIQVSAIILVFSGIATGTIGAVVLKSPNGSLKWDIYSVEVSHVKNGQRWYWREEKVKRVYS